MADMPIYSRGGHYNNNSTAEVPVSEDRLLDFEFIEDNLMFDPHFTSSSADIKPSSSDPLMSGSKVLPGAPLYDSPYYPSQQLHQRTPVESANSAAGPFLSNNFWLNPQTNPSSSSMAFQPVSIANQLPPVGAEYQIQTGGMDSMASPYSPESDGSYDDPSEAFQLHLPPGFDKEPITKLTEEQLVSLSARDLNTICRDLPEDVVKQLKKRRRTLKNRGYAYNSRVRRVSQKNQLEKERDELQKQIAQLQDKVKSLEREAEGWKRKAQMMERGDLTRQV